MYFVTDRGVCFDSHRRRPRKKLGQCRRGSTGSALSEMGPALFILMIFAVFPVLDLIFDGLGYSACVTLNELQLREAAKVPKSQATDPNGNVQNIIVSSWKGSLLGWLAPLTNDPQTDVSYDVGKGAIYVTVSTTVQVRPLLTIPFFAKMPGLGAPMVFTIAHSRILENPAYATY